MDAVSRARSAGDTPALTSGAYKFNNGMEFTKQM